MTATEPTTRRTAKPPSSNSANGNRPAPADDSAQAALLGTALTSALAADVLATLSPEDFWPPNGTHATVAGAILRVRDKGQAVDPSTVAGELGDQLKTITVDDAKGLGALLSLQHKGVSSNAASYAARITEKRRQRQWIELASRLADSGYEGSDPAEILAELDDFRAASEGDDSPLAQLRRHLIVGDQIDDLPALEPLIDGVLDLDTLAVLYGPSGHYKSLVALDWALSVATGCIWQRHTVRPGNVLYIVAEGALGMSDRKKAWQHAKQVHTCGGLHWETLAPNLMDETWVAALVQIVKEIRPVLVVIDTLARSMVGGDENTSRDMGAVVAAGDKIRRAAGSCVLMVHHSGKDLSAGARGSGALRAAVDTEWECTKDEDGAADLVNKKQKNRADGERLKLRLVEVPAARSVALAEWRGPTVDDELPESSVQLLRTLSEVDLGTGVNNTVWKTSSKVADSSFYRGRKRLAELGLIVPVGSGKSAPWRLTPAGAKLIGVTVDGTLLDQGDEEDREPDEEQF